ncbi:unnamed protein product, partial [Gulo gulo]
GQSGERVLSASLRRGRGQRTRQEVTQENSALLQAGARAARPPPWSCWHPSSARLPPDVVPAWPCLALMAPSRHALEAQPDGGPQQPRASCGFSASLVPHSRGPSHPLLTREPLCAAPASSASEAESPVSPLFTLSGGFCPQPGSAPTPLWDARKPLPQSP